MTVASTLIKARCMCLLWPTRAAGRAEGAAELRGDLACAQASKAGVLLSLGAHREASVLARQAVAVLKEEVGRTGRADLQQVLDWAINAFEEGPLGICRTTRG
jgi:hypothetical protein